TFLAVEELKVYRSLTGIQACANLAVAIFLLAAWAIGRAFLPLVLLLPWLACGVFLIARRSELAIRASIVLSYATVVAGAAGVVPRLQSGWLGCAGVSLLLVLALALHGHRLLRVARKLREMGIDPAVHPKRLVQNDSGGVFTAPAGPNRKASP
ncbi:MAG: hypothetical protein HY720_14480, partial [Planctomycetes bacterium]|nr:hypothetical protein [Planctomycetota bacterium]